MIKSSIFITLICFGQVAFCQDLAKDIPENPSTDYLDSLNEVAWSKRSSETKLSLKLAVYTLEKSFEKDYSLGMAESMRTAAYINYISGNYWDAIELYNISFEIFKSIAHKRGETVVTNGKGLVYFRLKQYEEARSSYLNAIKYANLMENNKEGIRLVNSISNNLGLLYLATGENEKAIDEFRRVLEYMISSENRQGESYLYNNIGEVHLAKEDLDSAKLYFDKSLSIKYEINDAYGLTYTFKNMANVALLENDTTRFFTISDSTIHWAKRIRAWAILEDVYTQKAEIYNNVQDVTKSLEMMKKAMASSDSISSQKSEFEIGTYYLSESINRVRDELVILKRENRDKLIVILLLVVIILIVVVFSIQLVKSFKERGRINTQLRSMVQMKDKLLSIISHDFTTPLNSLSGLVMLLKNNLITEKEKADLINEIITETANARELISNIITWASSNLSESFDEVIDINVKELVDKIIQPLEGPAERKNIKIKNQLTEDEKVVAHEETLKFVIRNILTNALKFSYMGGEVRVYSQRNDENMIINIQDYGKGMSKDTLDNLFEPSAINSQQGTKNEKGHGIGLSLCYDMIRHARGDIKVHSEPENGSTFSIII